MPTSFWDMPPCSLATLDYWTQVSIETHFKELVKEAQEANFTGSTHDYLSDEDETPFTG